MKMSELQENPTILEWLDNLGPGENTQRIYLQGMQAYTNFTGMTPEDLRSEAEDEISKGILPSHRKIKKHMIGFRKHLITSGFADHTIKARMMGVKSFYDSFEVELPKLKGERRKARTLEENDDIPSKEDIRAALKICDPLERAIILVGVSSGLASNEIINLKVKDFRNGYNKNTGVTTLELRRGKTGVSFITFLSSEATQAVNEYLEFRNRESKAPTARRKLQLDKQKVINDDGYLFISRQVYSRFLETGDEELRKLTGNAIQKLYRAISEKVRKNSKKGTYNVIRSHTMRKFFNSTLKNAGADSFHVEFFMGHALDDTQAAYFRADPDKLREIYLKFMPTLTIAAEYNPENDPNFQNLKQLSEAQAKVIESSADAQKRNREGLQELRAEMEKIKEISAAKESIRNEYMTFAELEKIRQMQNELQRELEEVQKIKATLNAGK